MFDDFVRFQAGINGNATALISARKSWTFAQLERDVRRAAHELSGIEALPGESVSVAVKLPYLEWVVILALARLGIATAPHTDSESHYRVTDSADEEAGEILTLSRDRIARIIAGPERPLLRVVPEPDAMGRVVRSSGTSGAPKRVGYSWRTLEGCVLHQLVTHGNIPGPWHIATGIKTPFAFHHVLAAWANGNSAVAGIGLEPEAIFRMKPRLLGLVPVQLQFLIDSLPPNHERWPLRIVTGGSALSSRLMERVREHLTDDVIINYGMTEVSQIATATLELIETEPRAAGYPRPGVEVRVVDAQDEDLPPGTAGRLCFRSNRPTSGYLDDPELTAQHYRDGWFFSNDVGSVREDGLLLLEGRVDDLMNLGGHKVAPAWIEQAAMEYSKIKEAAAFPFETDSGVDRCGLAVIAASGFEMEALQETLDQRLGRIQRIRIIVCEGLPRNEMGKVERAGLRKMMRAEDLGISTNAPDGTDSEPDRP